VSAVPLTLLFVSVNGPSFAMAPTAKPPLAMFPFTVLFVIERAARLWGAAEGVYSPLLTPPERAILRRWIEPHARERSFCRERAAGAALLLDEAIELALAAA
jgi:hypothetical protein